jgi:hypothetical protein
LSGQRRLIPEDESLFSNVKIATNVLHASFISIKREENQHAQVTCRATPEAKAHDGGFGNRGEASVHSATGNPISSSSTAHSTGRLSKRFWGAPYVWAGRQGLIFDPKSLLSRTVCDTTGGLAMSLSEPPETSRNRSGGKTHDIGIRRLCVIIYIIRSKSENVRSGKPERSLEEFL